MRTYHIIHLMRTHNTSCVKNRHNAVKQNWQLKLDKTNILSLVSIRSTVYPRALPRKSRHSHPHRPVQPQRCFPKSPSSAPSPSGIHQKQTHPKIKRQIACNKVKGCIRHLHHCWRLLRSTRREEKPQATLSSKWAKFSDHQSRSHTPSRQSFGSFPLHHSLSRVRLRSRRRQLRRGRSHRTTIGHSFHRPYFLQHQAQTSSFEPRQGIAQAMPQAACSYPWHP